MKLVLGVFLGALLVVIVGGALVAFPWSPFHSAIEGKSVERSKGSSSEAASSPTQGEDAPASKGDGQYSGKDSKILGTVEVAQDSVLSWTTTGENGIQSFAVMDKDFRINVSVQGKPSGQSLVKPGTYQDVTVNAVGDWTMSIDPR